MRAAIFSQTPASQGLQQPGYASDSRYPASSLPPLDPTTGGRTPASRWLAHSLIVIAKAIQSDMYLA